MLPFIGPEFVAALLERPAKSPSKRQDALAATPSLLAFLMCRLRALKASTITARLFRARKSGVGPNLSSRREPGISLSRIGR
jgi:hypothetical protein